MNTISQVEANKASTVSTLAESGENVGAPNEDVCNGRGGPNDNYNGSSPSRSRYGRMIKPKPSTNNVANSLQVCAVYFMLLQT